MRISKTPSKIVGTNREGHEIHEFGLEGSEHPATVPVLPHINKFDFRNDKGKVYMSFVREGPGVPFRPETEDG